MEGNVNWSLKDYETVYKEYPVVGPVPVADKLNRTVNSVVSRAVKLGVDVPRDFTDEEKAIAKQYSKQLGKALIFLLPGRTVYEIETLLQNNS